MTEIVQQGVDDEEAFRVPLHLTDLGHQRRHAGIVVARPARPVPRQREQGIEIHAERRGDPLQRRRGRVGTAARRSQRETIETSMPAAARNRPAAIPAARISWRNHSIKEGSGARIVHAAAPERSDTPFNSEREDLLRQGEGMPRLATPEGRP